MYQGSGKFNVRETLGTDTRAANANKKRGNQLTEMSPHNKYDGMRISGHEQNDLPEKGLSIFLSLSR